MPVSFSLKIFVLMLYSYCILEEGESEVGYVVTINGLLWTVMRNTSHSAFGFTCIELP